MRCIRSGIKIALLSLLPLMLSAPVYGSIAYVSGAPANSYVTYTASESGGCGGFSWWNYSISSVTYAGTNYSWPATALYITGTEVGCPPAGPNPPSGIYYPISNSLEVQVLPQDGGTITASVYYPNPPDAALRFPHFAPRAPSEVSLQSTDSAMHLASLNTTRSGPHYAGSLLPSRYAEPRGQTLLSSPRRSRARLPFLYS